MEPRAERPSSPDWLGGAELLPWSWAVAQLERERNYWVSTVRVDGRPQARPVWGVWMLDVLFLSIGHGGLQRARGRPDGRVDVSVNVDSARDVVIIEGHAERTSAAGTSQDRIEAAIAIYNDKYAWDLRPDMLNFVVRPDLVYGWRDEDVKTATRWTFD